MVTKIIGLVFEDMSIIFLCDAHFLPYFRFCFSLKYIRNIILQTWTSLKTSFILLHSNTFFSDDILVTMKFAPFSFSYNVLVLSVSM